MKKILLLTKNPQKIEEYQKFLSQFQIEGIPIEKVDPSYISIDSGKSYRQLAKKNAKIAARKYNMPAISERYGIELEAMPNYFGANTDQVIADTPRIILERLIVEKCKKYNKDDVSYFCGIALALPNGETFYESAELKMKLAKKFKGEPGDYLEHLFLVIGYRTTYSCLLLNDYQTCSPRLKALEKLGKQISKLN